MMKSCPMSQSGPVSPMPLFIYSTPLQKKHQNHSPAQLLTHSVEANYSPQLVAGSSFSLNTTQLVVLSAEPQKASVVIKKTKVRCQVWQTKKFGFLVGLVGSRVEKTCCCSLICFCENCLQKHQSTITIAAIAAPNSKITLKYHISFVFSIPA